MMESGYKSHKTELVAIYKLEFYRKQNNWKFAHETRKPAKTPRSKYIKIRKTLNETYSIEPEATNESTPLNNGFLDDKWDSGPESPQQTPAPANTLCEEPIHSLPWSAGQEYLVPERDDQQWWNVEQEVYSEPPWPDLMRPVTPQDYGEVVLAGNIGAVPYDCVDGPKGWSQDVQMEELISAIERYGTATDVSGQCLDQPVHSCLAGNVSSDSFASFIRGAHLAAHSSETDLQLDTREGCGWCGCKPAHLSSGALSRGVRTHAATLAALLREQAIRNRAQLSRTCCSEQLLLPQHSEPQWQDSRPLTRQDTFTVSCTNFGTVDTIGRGRGRLHRDHIIGIGMGRPYRIENYRPYKT